ncbi:MAG: dienelactone hydrolase family protein [Orrella sp.]
MTQHETLTSPDGHVFDLHFALPDDSMKGAVVVIPEIFGINSHIQSVVAGYAKAGYLAAAPALFDRVEPKYESGYEAADIEKGIALMQQISFEQAIMDVQTTVEHLRQQHDRVSAVGYCWGGTVAWLASARVSGLASSICYYPGGLASQADIKPVCPVMLHLGSEDKSPTPEAAQAVLAQHPTALAYFYPAGHGFNCDQRGSFHQASAALARERSLNLLELCAHRWSA